MSLLSLIKEFKVKLPVDLGKRIGKGAYGEVFEIKGSKSRVIKIAKASESEWPDLKKRLNDIKKSNNPAICKIYNFNKLHSFGAHYHYNNEILFFYICEKLNKINNDEADAIVYLLFNFKSSRIHKNVFSNNMYSFLRNVKKFKYQHQDIHSRNIMQTRAGKIKLIDCESFE